MTTSQITGVLQHLRRTVLLRDGAGLTDGQLLEDYLSRRDEAAVAALDALRTELEAKGAPVKDGWWGYRLLVIDDPDGNQLFFNYPNEP